MLYPSGACTCGPYASVVPPPPCPIHSYAYFSAVPIQPCQGRHCAHDGLCLVFGRTTTTTWNGS